MNTTSRVTRGLVGTIASVVLIAMPSFAAAGTASVLTKQVLPQGGNSCAPMFVQSVTPYIYDGELQSFDVVISDPSYVGVLGAAGDIAIPFNYMSRDINPDGSLRLHVDTTARIDGVLPVTVTLLSALPNAPVCLSQVSFTTDAAGSIETSNPIQVPTTPIDSGTGTSNGGSGSTSGGGYSGGTGSTGSTGSVKGNISSNPTVGSTSSTSTSIGDMVAGMCTKNGAYQLWFILLAIFFVIAAFVGLSEPALALRHGALPAVLIGIPLVLLLLFWQFATDCRLSYFIPVILLVAAAIGLYSAYRTNPMPRALALPAEKKTTSVTTTEETKTEIK